MWHCGLGSKSCSCRRILGWRQSIKDWSHSEFHVFPVLFRHGTGEWEFLQVPGGSDSHGQWLFDTESGDIEDSVGWEAFLAFEFPIVGVFLLVEVDFVVSSESFLEEIIEVIVIGWAHGVAAHLGAWVTDTGSHDFQESALVGFAHAVEGGFVEGGDGDVAWVGLLDGHDFLDDSSLSTGGIGSVENRVVSEIGISLSFSGSFSGHLFGQSGLPM